ncbi:undecaprenyl diphosphate synthase family protein [Aspergillus candidus]|uniref:Decaprenyl diphosphate synthase-like protein n=1 Tax=Aspergillus candidus TaxID=41067 RepID=A0A2I2F5X0_ASPCN|nr:Decaprenyl diphosphate synthase-like protein [Aspergillus candidus]PLB36013.1 Decaprenyl diphosphate synthase-like protein [Aspergillus candidus]
MSLEKAYQTGAQTLETILEFCFATGIQAVTVYAFSLANLQRSAEEVKAVMAHLKVCLARFLQDGGVAERFGVRLRLCGDRSLLPTETLEGLEHAERILGKNTKHVLNLCLAYGSRHEITSSVKAAVVKHSRRLCIAGQLDSPSQPGMTGHGLPLPRHDIIETLEDTMSTAGCPPLDFLIRTSGTRRLSDFMLWQCHETTDIVILKKNWPELLYWDFMQVFAKG